MPSIQSLSSEADEPHPQGLSVSIFERAYSDPAKTLVMAHVGQLVARGLAEWRLLNGDEIELRLSGGEIFVLGEETITRVS